jgi:hypothetical protein
MDFIDFTLFNIFLNQLDNSIYLICSIQNYPINENDIDIDVMINKLDLINRINKVDSNINNNFYKKIVKDNHEPILIFIYNLNNNLDLIQLVNSKEDIYIAIKYKNKKYIDKLATQISQLNRINNINTNNRLNLLNHNYFLTVTTLFKDDFNLFPIYYKYYKSQGVDHFYLYYNNNIENLDQNFYKYINSLNDVTLTEWNYRYLNDDSTKYKHHAQLGQIHDALYRFGKNNSKYMIFNDFDEYFKIKGITIKNYLLNNPNVSTFGFCNRWSTTVDKQIPTELPNTFLYGEKHDHGNRSKNILKVEDIETTGIHGYLDSITYNIVNPTRILNLDMFHFYNWSNKKRTYDTPYIYKLKDSHIKNNTITLLRQIKR